MAQDNSQQTTPVDALTRAFLLNYPRDAARKIETMQAEQAALLLRDQPVYVLLPVWKQLSPGVADELLLQLPEATAANLLTGIRFITDRMQSGGGPMKYEFNAKLDVGGFYPSIRVKEAGNINPG